MEKRERIIRTATALFVQKGIQSTSMSLLAKEAGVAAGTLYTYFESKEQLIQEAALSIYQKELAFIHKTYNSELPVKQRFADFLRASIQFMAEHPDWFLFMKLCCYLPELSADIKSMYEENAVEMYGLCEDGKIAGLFRNIATEELLFQVFGGISMAMYWRVVAHEKLAEDEIERLIHMAWNAISLNPDPA